MRPSPVVENIKYKPYKREARFWLVASVCSYGDIQGAGNRNYCAVATQGVSKRNPCWPGWRPAGARGQCVYACHRALESSMAQTDASDYYIMMPRPFAAGTVSVADENNCTDCLELTFESLQMIHGGAWHAR